MKIVFSHGYFIQEDEKEQKIMKPYPPLGILYISAWLDKCGIENEVFDTTFSTKKHQQTYLLVEKPAILALYANLMTKVNVIETMQFVREHLPETTIVLGGPDVRYNLEHYLKAGGHVAVIGEGEETMRELVEAIQAGNQTDFSQIDGVGFMLEGKLVQTKERSRIRPVDDLPFPNRHKIDIQKYLDTWKTYHGQQSMTMSTQRGCPYTCKWCSTAVYGQSYRRRSPAKVVEELKHLKETYQPESIWFVDDVFTVSHKWLAAFAEEVQKEDAIIPFECISRADRLNEEVIDLLKAAGCFRVWIGAESGSQKVIDLMDRRVDVNQVRDMIRMTRQKGMEAGTFIMLGYPGETEEDIRETVKHLKESNPDHFTITIAYPIKGTRLYGEVEAIQTKSLDWTKTTDRDRDFERTYSRKYYDYATRWVTNEVNWHKYKLLNQQLSPHALKTKLKSLVLRGMMHYEK